MINPRCIMVLLYLSMIKKKTFPPSLVGGAAFRAKHKLTAVIKIKYNAWAKPSSQTTGTEIIRCRSINFKRRWGGGGQRSIICVFACLCSRLPPRALQKAAERRHQCHSEIKNFHVMRGAARHPPRIFERLIHQWPFMRRRGDGYEKYWLAECARGDYEAAQRAQDLKL